MKAITYTQYGSPDVLELSEVTEPTPKDNEVLIRIHETLVTPSDVATRMGDPFAIRFFTGLLKPKIIMGTDLGGVVEAVGSAVTTFKKGDRVFGSTGGGFGTYAEYICLPEAGVLAILPDSLPFEATAGLCDAGMTALTFLRDHAKLQRGQHVLINGASGSVGTYAIQLARHLGAHVTAVCSGANVQLVKGLGADAVIDYTKQDFTQTGQQYDVIFDAVGKSSFARCKKTLTATGTYLTTVPDPTVLLQMAWTSRFGSQKAIFAATGLNQTKEKLLYLKDLILAGKLKSVVDRRYPFEQMAEAHRYVEAGHKRGNVVITV